MANLRNYNDYVCAPCAWFNFLSKLANPGLETDRIKKRTALKALEKKMASPVKFSEDPAVSSSMLSVAEKNLRARRNIFMFSDSFVHCDCEWSEGAFQESCGSQRKQME